MEKKTAKTAIVSGVVGAVLMFALVLALEFYLDQHPPIETQVCQYFEKHDYQTDTLKDGYIFSKEDIHILYTPPKNDPSCLQLRYIYIPDETSVSALKEACQEVTAQLKLSYVVPDQWDEYWCAVISVDTLLDPEEEIPEQTLDRMLSVIASAAIEIAERCP